MTDKELAELEELRALQKKNLWQIAKLESLICTYEDYFSKNKRALDELFEDLRWQDRERYEP